MNQWVIILFCCLESFFVHAQDNFTLSLELMKPSGKIDKSSYFAAKLQNHNDSLGFVVDIFGDGYYHNQRHSFLRIIYGEVGREKTGHEQPFFWFGDNKIIVIKPDSTWIVNLPLFIPLVGIGNGVLPQVKDGLRDYQRVRIKLEKFTFVLLYNPKYNVLPAKKTIDLYSNWVEIPWGECKKLLLPHNE